MKQEVVERIVTEVTKRVIEQLQLLKITTNFLFIGKKPNDVSDQMLEIFFASEKTKPLVIGWNFSLASLMRCSQMMPLAEDETQMIQALLEKKRVYIVRAKNDDFSANFKFSYNIRKKIKEMENNLHSYGVKFVYLTDLLAVNNSRLTIRKTQRYVTEKQLQRMKLGQNTTLFLPKECRLTDMARDFINENTIEVKYDK